MKRGILQLSDLSNWRCLRHLRVMVLIPLMLSTFVVQAQLAVKGKITDETGNALPGVNVLQKGTTIGTTSDGDGNYSIAVEANDAVLVFSFIGYGVKEVPVGGQSVIDVNLEPDIQALAEVVVVGYGTQKREAVTGSVISVSGDALREVPSGNVTQALQGRAVGVEISQTSTKPGAAMQMLIRGQRSLTGSNDPLIVLDGIPFVGQITDINSNTIKSIDILKDASATAIYGSRGSNGVILITTSRGQKGQKATINYNGYYGVKKLFAKYPMMDGQEFAALRAASLQKFNNTIDESNDTNTDWQSMIYRSSAAVTSHNLNISAGGDKGSYTFGLGYYRDEAIVPLQNFTRYSMNGSIDQEVGKHVRLGFTTNSNFSITMGDNVPAVGSALSRSPIANPYNTDGSLKNTIIEQTSGSQWTPSRSRFENLGDKYIDQTKAYASYNSAYAEVKIPGIEGLKYRTNLGLTFRQNNYGNYTGQGVFSGTPSAVSTASTSNSLTTNWAVENMLTYDRNIGKHEFNAIALYSAQKNFYNSSQISARDIPNDDFQFYNLGRADGVITVDPANQAYNIWGLESYMGRVMYTFDERFNINASFRSDGSSRLAPGHQWHAYPAVSAGWNISKEQFMSGINAINFLKLRVGYGQNANQTVDPYKTLGTLNTRPYNFGDATSTGFYIKDAPSPNLGWEYTKGINYGLDFKLLNNRLSGTIEYYVQKTYDVLLYVGLPATSGAQGYTNNIGNTQNKGIEITLNGTLIDNQTSGFKWDIGFNVYANRNKLVSLPSGQTRDEGNWFFVGHPINVIYDYEKVGLWQPTDQYRNILEPGGNDGMIKVKYTGTYNSDGSPTRAIGAADRQIMSMQPNFQGGFNSHASYKGFDLSIIGTFKNGGLVNSTLYGSGSYLNNLNSRSGNNVKVDYWTPTNTGAKYPAPGGVGGDNPKYGSTLGYFDASYMKIRTITLGYNLTQKMLKKTGISNLRIYCTVQNPFVMFSPFHKESGLDPEANSYGNQNAAVPLSDNLKRILTIGTNTPSTRNYLLGVSLTF